MQEARLRLLNGVSYSINAPAQTSTKHQQRSGFVTVSLHYEMGYFLGDASVEISFRVGNLDNQAFSLVVEPLDPVKIGYARLCFEVKTRFHPRF
jgi:hypothetical protein